MIRSRIGRTWNAGNDVYPEPKAAVVPTWSESHDEEVRRTRFGKEPVWGVRPKQDTDWTDIQISDLVRLWGEGHSARVVGLKLERSRNAVIGKVHRLGLAKRQSTAGERKKPGRKKGNPGAFRKSRAKPPELRVVRVKPVRAREVPPPEARMISLLELTPRDCKWPIGHPGEPGFAFCGARSFASFPYCEHHTALAYTPVKARGQAPKQTALHSGVNGSWRQPQVQHG